MERKHALRKQNLLHFAAYSTLLRLVRVSERFIWMCESGEHEKLISIFRWFVAIIQQITTTTTTI